MYILLIIAIPFMLGVFYKSYHYFNRLTINNNMKDFVYNFVKYSLEKHDFIGFEPIDYRRLEINPVNDSYDIDMDVFVAENKPNKNTANEIFMNIKGNITSEDVYKLYSLKMINSFDYNELIPESVFQLNSLGLGFVGKLREFVTSKLFKYQQGYDDNLQECTFATKQGRCENPVTKKLDSNRDFINIVNEQSFSNHDNERFYKENPTDGGYNCELNIPDESEFPIKSTLNLKCREKFENVKNKYVVHPDMKAKDNLQYMENYF